MIVCESRRSSCGQASSGLHINSANRGSKTGGTRNFSAAGWLTRLVHESGGAIKRFLPSSSPLLRSSFLSFLPPRGPRLDGGTRRTGWNGPGLYTGSGLVAFQSRLLRAPPRCLPAWQREGAASASAADFSVSWQESVLRSVAYTSINGVRWH